MNARSPLDRGHPLLRSERLARDIARFEALDAEAAQSDPHALGRFPDLWSQEELSPPSSSGWWVFPFATITLILIALGCAVMWGPS